MPVCGGSMCICLRYTVYIHVIIVALRLGKLGLHQSCSLLGTQFRKGSTINNLAGGKENSKMNLFFPHDGLSKFFFLQKGFLQFFSLGEAFSIFFSVEGFASFFFLTSLSIFFPGGGFEFFSLSNPGEGLCKFIFSWRRPFQIFFLEEALLNFFPGEGPLKFFSRFPPPPRSLMVVP